MRTRFAKVLLQRSSLKVHDLRNGVLTRTVDYVMETLLDALGKNRSSGVLKETEESEIQCLDDSIGQEKRYFFN